MIGRDGHSCGSGRLDERRDVLTVKVRQIRVDDDHPRRSARRSLSRGTHQRVVQSASRISELDDPVGQTAVLGADHGHALDIRRGAEGMQYVPQHGVDQRRSLARRHCVRQSRFARTARLDRSQRPAAHAVISPA
jgi:hypothetical protein